MHVQAVHEGSGGSWDAEEVRVCVPEGTGQGAGGRQEPEISSRIHQCKFVVK